ncbi:MAG TPA: hypothetical protein VGZ22_01815 [Isosphaeraceae bacterium]|nr:hypothetical protein [Isosphaeraceae bacterium]
MTIATTNLRHLARFPGISADVWHNTSCRTPLETSHASLDNCQTRVTAELQEY